ncbi:UvrD-helicase domain-containing protein [Marinobacterium rhizophilum]|uniref:UvrD-helicase domain-containing protein n=1 Tax=Marinobacterium rhizophilum TaxID=420402 RepID=UPI000376FE05|nr:DUF5710 domain-containing protein [Marinobacterium rhizophilum]
MRMPNTRQITDEQEEIYMDAPMDGAIIVTGPPGTGKTVIAFLRAQVLKRKNLSVQVLMYNRVLQKYTSNVVDDQSNELASSTLLRWFKSWWVRHKIETPLEVGDKIYLDCPYENKDEVKNIGARWDKNHYNPKRRRRGQWYAPIEAYNRNTTGFLPWIAKDYDAPKIAQYQYDWQQILLLSAEYFAAGKAFNDWGHIIIDEAQDFPTRMYNFIRFAAGSMKNGAITILADENQRLSEDENSTIDDIIKALSISSERQFSLTENHRNTRPIAELAAYFYVGLKTGKPKLPHRKGDKPELVATTGLDQQVEYIVKVLKSKSVGEVGVFTQNDSLRRMFLNRLEKKLSGFYQVQTYSSKDSESNNIDRLTFDKSATVSILNRHSCKGLEFDFVFIPELQSILIDGSNLDAFKMNMYVMCSRAREGLYLLYSSKTNCLPAVIGCLPNESSGLLEYKNG